MADSYFAAGIRKRTLSSDTTDSSGNEHAEDGGASPAYNLYQNRSKSFEGPNSKSARLGNYFEFEI